MAWAVTGAVGGTVLGGLFGNKQQKSANQANIQAAEIANRVPNAKLPYLQYGWEQGKGELNRGLGMGTHYTGQRVAEVDGLTNSGIHNNANFVNGMGTQGAQGLFGTGMGMMGAGTQFMGNAGALYGQAGQDPTQQILNNAGQYANNPYVDGIIDASTRDVARNLGENQMTGLALGASGSGNTNSTRAGVAEGIMKRGASEQMADISSKIRGQFFNQGLGMAQNQYNQNFSNQLNANSQLNQAFGAGMDGMYKGQNMVANNFDLMNAGGQIYQQNRQQQLLANQDAWNEQRSGNIDLISKYLNMTGEVGNFQAPQVQSGGAMGGAMAGAGLGMQLGKAFGGYNQKPSGNTYTGQSGWDGKGGWGDSVGGEGE